MLHLLQLPPGDMGVQHSKRDHSGFAMDIAVAGLELQWTLISSNRRYMHNKGKEKGSGHGQRGFQISTYFGFTQDICDFRFTQDI